MSNLILRQDLFVLSNTFIALGYVFLASYIAPRFNVRLKVTKIGGAVFFLTCGLHHLEDGVVHLLYQPNETVQHAFLAWHMVILDIVQVVSVFMFIYGLYVEFVRDGIWPGKDIPSIHPKDE